VATVPGTLALFRAEPQADALPRLKAAFPQTEAMGAWLRVFAEGSTTPEPGRRLEEVGLQSTRRSPHPDWFAREPELEDVFVAMLRQRAAPSWNRSGRRPHAPHQHRAGHRGPRLTRVFGDFRAADAVSFQVPQGEIFGLLGANGAGKTTVIKMLTGILKPSSGEGRVAGADMRSAGWRSRSASAT
jgi:ABC-2 type transport system ATP-binding protein